MITLLIVQSGRWNHIQKESKTVGDPFRLPAPALVAARPATVAGPTAAAAAPATAAIAPATAAIAPSSAADLNDLDHLGLRGPTAAPATATGPGIRAPATAAAAADPRTWAPATAAAVATTADPGTRAPATAANDARRTAGNECAEYNKQFHPFDILAVGSLGRSLCLCLGRANWNDLKSHATFAFISICIGAGGCGQAAHQVENPQNKSH